MAFGHTYNQQNVDTNKGKIFIPAGDYDVQIVNVTDEVSRSSGRDQIKLEIQVISGPCKGGKLFYYIVDDQYADQKIWEVLTACRRQIPPQVTSNTFRGGLTGRLRVKNETYQGEQKSVVNYWLRPKPGESAPAPVNQTAPNTDKPAHEITEDDIPF